jgi:hypothetical protein
MHTSGGRVSVTINGVNYSARGVIKLMPSNMSVSAGVNQDGTVYRTVQPKPRTAELTFDRFVDLNGTAMVWNEAIFSTINFGCTFIEDDTNTTHLLSNAFFTGDPNLDTSTGEVDGVGIAAESYKSVPSS